MNDATGELMTDSGNPREWWEEEPPHELQGLPDYIVTKLVANDITTLEQVRLSGPDKLREIHGLGGRGIERIKSWLREQLRPTEEEEERP